MAYFFLLWDFKPIKKKTMSYHVKINKLSLNVSILMNSEANVNEKT